MTAVVQDRYGSPDVLALRAIDKPAVHDDLVLVRVHAAAVNVADVHYLTGLPYFMRLIAGLHRPKIGIRGMDVAGHVEAIGPNVQQVHPGDEVFGWCDGTFAEYVCAGENHFVPKPANITFEQAAAIPLAACTALQALRDVGHVQPGQKVLINGSSGGVGTFAVQLAKALGAEVTGVCSTGNVEMVRSIGADHVIDYTQEDFTRSGQRYDLILDQAANHSLSDLGRPLAPGGMLILNSDRSGGRWMGPLARMARARALSLFVGRRMSTFLAHVTREDLTTLKEFVESGKVTPVIDRTYPLSATSEALGYVAAGHARAKVVIIV